MMTEETQLTAIEWLISDLISKGLLTLSGDTLKSIGKAKEMEKKQREEDLESGFDTGRLYQGREGDTTLGQLKLNRLDIL